MNGYLVLWSTSFDDLPIGLFATRDEAMRTAAAVSQTDADEVAAIMKRYNGKASCVTVVQLVRGHPYTSDVVRVFEDTPDVTV